jgi:hypothetical protein
MVDWKQASSIKDLIPPSRSGPPPLSAGTTESEPTLTIESSSVTFFGLISLVAGLSAMVVGAGAIALVWTEFASWAIPLALFALVVGTVALLFDWFRDVARFSTSVPGVATGTVALCIAFVSQGGLDFNRYRPCCVSKTERRLGVASRANDAFCCGLAGKCVE